MNLQDFQFTCFKLLEICSHFQQYLSETIFANIVKYKNNNYNL